MDSALDLVNISLREIRMPLREPFVISSGKYHHRRILLVAVRDGDGTEGLGECVAAEIPNYSPETVDTAWLAISEWIAPAILGRAFAHPSEILPWLDREIRGHLMAKAAVEMACWALVAERNDLSLAVLLGGSQQQIPVGISLGMAPSIDAMSRRVQAALAEGYRRVKVKIAPGKDVEVVRRLRDEAGADAPLMVDANNAYTEDDIPILRLLDSFNLLMIEQPFYHTDLLRHARLQRMLRTPLCLDESITSIADAEDMIQLKSGRIVNIKPGRVGGFSSALAIHDLCRRHRIQLWCGGMLESGIGRAHNVALASLPGFTLPGDISPSRRYWEEDIVTPAWTMTRDGFVQVPFNRSGIGVEPRWDLIDRLTARTAHFDRR